MIALVLTVGMLNLAIGFALGVYVRTPCGARWRTWLPAGWAPALGIPDPADEPLVDAPTPASPDTVYPSHWEDWDRCQSIVSANFDEALLWVLQNGLATYRRQLLAWEHTFRTETGDDLRWEQLEECSRHWQEQLQAWMAELSATTQWRAAPDIGTQIEETLLNHHYRLQSAGAALAQLRDQPPGPATRQSVLREVLRIFDAVNSLRDRCQELLAGILTIEQLRELPEDLQVDGTSETLTWLGMARLVHDWQEKDPERIRLVSGVLVDIDRVGTINERMPLAAVDHTLAQFGALLRSLVRQTRGFDRVLRRSGESFLLFLGDTSARNAINGAERIRQSVEATSFRAGEHSIELTISTGVAEWRNDESLSAFLDRLERLVAESKKAGRNRSCVDDSQETRVMELPQYQVQGRVFEIPSGSESAPCPDSALSVAG